MGAVLGENEPPSELMISRLSDWFGDPYGGGWMDWPAGLPNRVATLRNYEQAVRLFQNNRQNPKWVDANPSIYQKVTELYKLRKEAGYTNYMF